MTPHVVHLASGDPSAVVEIMPSVLTDISEMLWQATPEEATQRVVTGTEELDRVEITVRDPSGCLIGFASAAHDEDDHVGPVLGVQWLYVAPAYRNRGIGRQVLSALHGLAVELDYRVLAFTHRISEGRYTINYKRL